MADLRKTGRSSEARLDGFSFHIFRGDLSPRSSKAAIPRGEARVRGDPVIGDILQMPDWAIMTITNPTVPLKTGFISSVASASGGKIPSNVSIGRGPADGPGRGIPTIRKTTVPQISPAVLSSFDLDRRQRHRMPMLSCGMNAEVDAEVETDLSPTRGALESGCILLGSLPTKLKNTTRHHH